MAFITKSDLEPFITQDDLSVLSEGVAHNITASIAEAESTVKDYLRNRYDVNAIFDQTGDSRNVSILGKTIDICLFLLHRKMPSNMIPERRVFLYETAMHWLEDVSKGEKITLDAPTNIDADGNEVGFRITYGGNPKIEQHGY